MCASTSRGLQAVRESRPVGLVQLVQEAVQVLGVKFGLSIRIPENLRLSSDVLHG